MIIIGFLNDSFDISISRQSFRFVPASGDANAGSVQNSGGYGVLWSSSLSPSQVNQAWYFGFNAPEGNGNVNDNNRYNGTPLRGVCLLIWVAYFIF